jgi:hypothetical protein
MRKSVTIVLVLVGAAALLIGAGAPAGGGTVPRAQAGAPSAHNPFCRALGTTIAASGGAQLYCNGPSSAPGLRPVSVAKPAFGSNVDAADFGEDIAPSGIRAYGQSEVSVAGAGPYVVEAWNDATGFLTPCGDPNGKEELTGLGFSKNGGARFTDLGGVPNSASCASGFRAVGDPSVEVAQFGGKTYFYVESMYDCFDGCDDLASYLEVTACSVQGAGSRASLACADPVLVAESSSCGVFTDPDTGDTYPFCSFLDKGFLTIDPARHRLYASYSEFFFDPGSGDEHDAIELAACDISVPSAPSCPQPAGPNAPTPPYLVVDGGSGTDCENEGAYPAVDPQTGDVYVAYERNWAAPLFCGGGEPPSNVIARISAACLTLPTASCGGPAATAETDIVSSEFAPIAGYDRYPTSSFPRIAVSVRSATVSMVWNDARQSPLGDIVMQSFELGSLEPVQDAPLKLNNDPFTGALHFLPALRNVDRRGRLAVTWYDRRRDPQSAKTDVYAALKVDPRTTRTPKNSVVTTALSDWRSAVSLIGPNFGDYTDNYVDVADGKSLLVAWTDGRLNIPQPFMARVPLN